MLNCSCHIPLLLKFLVDKSRTGRNRCFFCNALTGKKTYDDKSTFVESVKKKLCQCKSCQLDGHIAEISCDNLSIAGQQPWFIGQNREEDRYDFSEKAFWRPAIWSTVGEYRWSEWQIGEHTQWTI